MSSDCQINVTVSLEDAVQVNATTGLHYLEYTCQPPQFSAALSFNGVSQYGLVSIIPVTHPFSLEVVAFANVSQQTCPFAVGNNSDATNYHAVLIDDTNTIEVIRRTIESGGNLDTFITPEPPTNVRVDFINPTDYDVYSNGGLIASVRDAASVEANNLNTANIGTIRTPSVGALFNGDIAHASINGVSIPFNNETPYDLTYDTDEKTVVNFINDPVQSTQKVVHKEFEFGYFAAVRGDGATARIDTGITADQVTSMKCRYIVPPLGTGGSIMGCRTVSNERFYIFTTTTSSNQTAYIGGSFLTIPATPAQEITIEIIANGDVYVDGVFYQNIGDIFSAADTTSTAGFCDRIGNSAFSPSNVILLQGWVNGNEIDIHDSNLHRGTISEHRLIDQS